ncbi:hypothetical protein B0H14DRAFT_2592351 [Mycena olivaceomarginata]|nr:hypothetical protein B0H14DRAFT_2592351 [Mycena olivaceomarginata]
MLQDNRSKSYAVTTQESAKQVALEVDSKEAVIVLEKAWSSWGPSIFPGSRIVPPATHSHIQVDGIPHAAVSDLKDLKNEFMERYPELGQVVGIPIWVNHPPSQSQASADG